MWILILIILSLLSYLLYKNVIKPMNYWKRLKVIHKSRCPIDDGIKQLFLRQKSLVDIVEDLYKDFPNERCNGLYSIMKPQLLIRGPDLIKQIAVKDFDHFMDHGSIISMDVDPLFAKTLGALKGQQWRDMRATLSPSFTSSKMRFMFNLMADCAKEFVEHFKETDTQNMEMKDIFTRFTNDVIATTAFGIKVNSLKDKENEFFLLGKDFTSFGLEKMLRTIGYLLFPSVMKFFKISITSSKFTDFFHGIIKETIEVRETKGVIRPDMIHLLLESRRGKALNESSSINTPENNYSVVEDTLHDNEPTKTNLTDLDITAQAILFFLAGFEPAATLMCFTSHELAVNPEVQKKLQAEIDETLVRCNRKLTYEALQGMEYMDMVISESLRKWPPAVALDRVCVKDYIIQPTKPEEQPILVEKGINISIPIIALHRDPKYFPEPLKFDPERFSEENKGNIVPFTYLPFGVGPRSCIASRFALMETKILFFYLLSEFDIITTEKTVIPLVLSKKKVVLQPDEGFWLGLQSRRNVD